MGFKRKGRCFGMEVKEEGYVGWKKTCIRRKWEIIFFSQVIRAKCIFLRKGRQCNMREAWRNRQRAGFLTFSTASIWG